MTSLPPIRKRMQEMKSIYEEGAARPPSRARARPLLPSSWFAGPPSSQPAGLAPAVSKCSRLVAVPAPPALNAVPPRRAQRSAARRTAGTARRCCRVHVCRSNTWAGGRSGSPPVQPPLRRRPSRCCHARRHAAVASAARAVRAAPRSGGLRRATGCKLRARTARAASGTTNARGARSTLRRAVVQR